MIVRTMHRVVVFVTLFLVALVGPEPLATAVEQGQTTDVIGFRVIDDGGATRIVIHAVGPVRYRDEFEPLPPKLTVELMGVRAMIPLREYDDIYRGGIRYVVTSAPAPDRVRFDIALDGVTSYAIYQQGTDVIVTFENPGPPFSPYVTNAVDDHTQPPSGAVIAQTSAPVTDPSRSVAEPGLSGLNGERITLAFQNTEISTVIRAFGEISGRSIVAGSGVRNVLVTADIRDQPWDEALVTLMHANGLEVRLENDILRVDTVENLRKTEALIDLKTVVSRLNFITASEVALVVDPLKSERGSIQADAKTNSLVITDVPDRVDRIVDIVRELDVQTPQVTIKAKIVFVNKVDLRELGLKWRVENLRDPTVDTHVLANTGGTLADPFLDLSIGTLASGLNIGGLLQALEQREMVDIQAEPQTTVLNNLPAEVFVGERTPIRVLDLGAQTEEARASVELIETGIILRVTPHITSNGKVLMQLMAERSGVAVADPEIGVTFSTQRATSQILVNDGETAVIGGLTVQDYSSVRSGVPVLKDIPLLGALFRTERKRREKRDLLIFVTPYVVPVERPDADVISQVCLEDQPWYRSDRAIVHNGDRWTEFGAPHRVDPRDLVKVGNYRGVSIFTTVESAAVQIYLPLCATGMYRPYRLSSDLRGTHG